MMHYSTPSPTAYSSLPSAPTINAMPQGIPRGPWGPLYRSAPGAQIPAVRYPGMSGALGATGVVFQGALGSVPGVNIVGALGQNGMLTAGSAVTGLLLAGALSAAYGAGIAYFVKSRKPVRNTALYAGGVTIGTGLLALLVAKAGNGAAA